MKITVEAPDYMPLRNEDIARLLYKVASKFENKDEDEVVESSTLNETVYFIEDDWYLDTKIAIEI